MEDSVDYSAIWAEAFAAKWGPAVGGSEETAVVAGCGQCTHASRYTYYAEGYEVCLTCGVVTQETVFEKVTWAPHHSFKAGYQRIHFFNERFNQFMGNEPAVPKEVVESVRALVAAPVTKTKIRAALRKLGSPKYIERWISIWSTLTGEAVPSMISEDMRFFRELFVQIERAFMTHRPAHRKSMISYNFLFVRMLQIRGLPQFYKFFPQLKSKAKFKFIDGVWGDMCRWLNIAHLPFPHVKGLR
jgi:hypothetical protein